MEHRYHNHYRRTNTDLLDAKSNITFKTFMNIIGQLTAPSRICL